MVAPVATQLDLVLPYVPRLLVRHLEREPDARVRALPGSMVFVDVSGFTRLSERLARKGKEGAEELAQAIGSCFASLLELAYEDGGGLLKFGGDALLLFFEGPGHEVRACRSAVRMRRRLREVGRLRTTEGPVTLRMSSGVHAGTFHLFVVGGSHRELIVTGPASTRTVEMESTAGAGEILVSEELAAVLPARVLGEPKGDGRHLRREPRGAPFVPLEPVAASSAEIVLEGVPVAIRERLLAGAGVPEHRRATVAFLHFEGTDALIEDAGADAAAEALERLVRDVQDAVERHGVAFLGSDVDRDGGKLILTAGVPDATGDDEERMLHALREIVERPREISVRVGVNHGSVFAGDIGPSYRRTYTVMGDAVNLAARLMSQARPGELLASPGVLERSRTRFATRELEPFFVKGKTLAQRAFAVGSPVGGRAARGTASLPLLGRGSELEELRSALAASRAGSGRAIRLVGEPGAGKSRLLEELVEEAADVRRLTVACELYEAQGPYRAARRLLLAALERPPEATDVEVAERLGDAVGDLAPHLEPWLPLIAALLDVPWASTPEVDALDDRFRRPRLEAAAVELLEALLPDPTLLTIEDGQWMDDATAGLLEHLALGAAGRPWLVVEVRRAAGATGEADTAGAAGPLEIPVGPLTAAAARELVALATEDDPLSPQTLEIVVQRAGGNPLFLLELAAAVRAAGTAGGLPDSVGSVVAARIDGLPQRERDLLRRASVLGPSFGTTLLSAVLDEEPPAEGDPRWRRLDGFLERNDGTVAFTQKLIRDVAYDGLPFGLRRALHARVGEALERAAPDPDEDAEVLSLHFILARRNAPAWRYARIAGRRAEAKFAPSEAARFYRRALEAARALPEIEPAEVAAVWEALGDASDRAGAYASADAAYAAGRRLHRGRPVDEARLWLKQAWIPEREGSYPLAIRRIGRARALVERVDTEEAGRLGAQLAAWQAAVRQAQGRSREAVRWCRRAIGEAEAAGNRDALAHAFFILDWALFDLDRPDEVGHSEKALAIYEELGDLGRQASVLNNMGGLAYWEGRWDEAVERYERSREVRLRTGDHVGAAECAFNVGEIRSDQGRLEEAETLIREALRVWRAAGYRWGEGFALSYLGRVSSRAGRSDEATERLGRARAILADIGAEGELLQTDAFLAECAALRGRSEEALRIAEDALGRAQRSEGAGAHLPLLHRIRGSALAQKGDLAGSRAALGESLRSARARRAGHEAALTVLALGRLDVLEAVPPDAPARRDAETTLERLGVVAVTEMPLEAPA